MKKLCRILALSVLGCVLPACEDDPAPAAVTPTATLAAAATAPAAAPAAAAPTSEASTPAYVYSYNPAGRRDPFRNPEEGRSDVPTSTSSQPCAGPLCQWDLDQLKLVAVVTGDANPMAMVEDPLGRGHIIRRNTQVGRQGGKVTQILRDSVTVTEYFPGADGKLIANPVSLQLKPEDRMAPPYDLFQGKNWE
jgi:type IV pilus assembly protein PilP